MGWLGGNILLFGVYFPLLPSSFCLTSSLEMQLSSKEMTKIIDLWSHFLSFGFPSIMLTLGGSVFYKLCAKQHYLKHLQNKYEFTRTFLYLAWKSMLFHMILHWGL